jgi:hypothetical protein
MPTLSLAQQLHENSSIYIDLKFSLLLTFKGVCLWVGVAESWSEGVPFSVGATQSLSEGIVLHILLHEKFLRSLETSVQPLKFTSPLKKKLPNVSLSMVATQIFALDMLVLPSNCLTTPYCQLSLFKAKLALNRRA